MLLDNNAFNQISAKNYLKGYHIAKIDIQLTEPKIQGKLIDWERKFKSVCIIAKLRQITRPGIALCQKLADSEIIHV